jgi:hypothetical protein
MFKHDIVDSEYQAVRDGDIVGTMRITKIDYDTSINLSTCDIRVNYDNGDVFVGTFTIKAIAWCFVEYEDLFDIRLMEKVLSLSFFESMKKHTVTALLYGSTTCSFLYVFGAIFFKQYGLFPIGLSIVLLFLSWFISSKVKFKLVKR